MYIYEQLYFFVRQGEAVFFLSLKTVSAVEMQLVWKNAILLSKNTQFTS